MAKKPRKMNKAERERFANDFPRMNLDEVIVTDDATDVYNCMAWTLGNEKEWIWPEELKGARTTKEKLDPYYFKEGYITSPNFGNVAVWGSPQGLINHVSVVLPRGKMESKFDKDLRLIHKPSDLGGKGSRYGDIVLLYYYLLKPIG